MSSMDAGYNRAAVLKQAARRSQFVARIEKYEAKVRQEQKARALHRQQRAAMESAIVEQSAGMAGQKASLVEKINLPDRREVLPQHNVCKSERRETILERREISTDRLSIQHQSEEREESPEQKTIPERNEIPIKQIRIATVSGVKAVSRNSAAGDAPSLDLAEEINSLAEDSGDASIITEVKPTAVTELNMVARAAALKIRLKAADMTAPMQEHAFRCARETLDSLEKLHCKRVAFALKKEFDTTYGPAWHCIVGTSFGSYVTHSLGGFVYFSIDKVSVLLFKTTVEPL